MSWDTPISIFIDCQIELFRLSKLYFMWYISKFCLVHLPFPWECWMICLTLINVHAASMCLLLPQFCSTFSILIGQRLCKLSSCNLCVFGWKIFKWHAAGVYCFSNVVLFTNYSETWLDSDVLAFMYKLCDYYYYYYYYYLLSLFYRVVTIIYLKETMFPGYLVLHPFCNYNS